MQNGVVPPIETARATAAALRACAAPDRLPLLGLRPEDEPTVRAWFAHLASSDADLTRIADLAAGVRAVIGHWDAPSPPVFGDHDREHALGSGVLPLAALAITAPDLAAHLAGRGIPGDVIAATIGDIGNQVAKHRRVHGATGLHNQGWLLGIWRGGLLALGRLQFEWLEGPVLSVHIPATGPLPPDAVDAAFARASAEMPGWYPEAGTPLSLHCDSWLLDPQLPVLLPGSRLAAFQQRWRVSRTHRNDVGAAYFAFDAAVPEDQEPTQWVDDLPVRTRLHRVLVDHWRSGGHLSNGEGTVPLG